MKKTIPVIMTLILISTTAIFCILCGCTREPEEKPVQTPPPTTIETETLIEETIEEVTDSSGDAQDGKEVVKAEDAMQEPSTQFPLWVEDILRCR